MSDEESAFDVLSEESDFAPKPKAKAKVVKAPPKEKVPKKATVPKATKPAKPKPTIPKKRVKDEENDSDNEPGAFDDESLLNDTPPKAKKQKMTANAVKSPHNKPLAELVQENMEALGESSKQTKKKRVSEQYQKLTQLEHIIKRPDTYIGSIEKTEKQTWVYNIETSSMEYREITYVPGLFKIFDEILVNAADNKQNDPNMKEIKVVIDREKGEISVQNDGKGIPVEIHSKEQVYIPEMIFGHLLAGSNFDDNQQKVTGGRNGYGAKLCNIFSTEFTVETSDKSHKKKYKQTWSDNMSNMGKAKIADTTSKDDYTKVTFKPDFAKFGLDGLDDDHVALFTRRVYDLCGTMPGVKIHLNGSRIPISNFKKYIELYTKAIKDERGEEAQHDQSEIITEKCGDRWEIGFAVSDGSFQQVSFVNSIATTVGGTHVNYIADQITGKLADFMKKKNKTGAQLKANQIRNHIFIFVNCLIVNPAFSSQTKEQLTTKASQFGSKCVVSDEFIKKVQKTQVIENIMAFAEKKADQILKKSDGARRSRIHDPKLTDANKAGTKDGHLCTLILTEGESAKGMAMAGRAVVGADVVGVFPLRGKLLNVRDANPEQVSKNKEIQNIKNFLGLKHKTVYTDTKSLRYGHLMIMTDQDHDGSHIKGLLINFLQVSFPSLLKIPGFLVEFITPIIKVWKGDPRNPTKARAFYTMPEYLAWKEAHKHEKGWEHKYYKGLGTSSIEESQQYFNDLDKHHKDFEVMEDEEVELIELAFSKKKADERKEWLRQFRPGTYFDHSARKISYTDFVNKELILFSMADNIRSIPSVVDGLKPTQRKVLYTCFKRNIKKDMKVVELAGLVSGLTAYQHGDVSLQQTIVGLAQSFVGSNNVNTLFPAGQFGTRLQGGQDAASARYIYTRLSPFARKLFHAADEPLLKYNTDDDKQIEPETYVPVVPMVLINGSDGIGTGWSSSIPNYSPEDIVDNLRRKMKGEDFQPMRPWFRGFKGEVTEAGPDRWKFTGVVTQKSDQEVEITELPVRMWTQDFKERLEEIIKAEKVPSWIKDYKDYNTHADVHFDVTLDEKHMEQALKEGLEEKFKLSKTMATSNLVAFDPEGRITKYASVDAIMEEFYAYRLRFYQLRKDHMLEDMNKDLKKLSNQARFIKLIIENKLVISRKKKSVLIAELKKLGFDAFPKKEDASKAGELEKLVDEAEDDDNDQNDETLQASSYDYLLGMALWSLTQERVERLEKQIAEKELEINELLEKSREDLWSADLDEFITEWRFQLEDEKNRAKQVRKGRRESKKFGAGNKRTARKDDDDDFAVTKTKVSKKLADSKPKIAKDKQSTLSGFVKTQAEKVDRTNKEYVPSPKKPALFQNHMTAFSRSPQALSRKVDVTKPARSDEDPGLESLSGPIHMKKLANPIRGSSDFESDAPAPAVTKTKPITKSNGIKHDSDEDDLDDVPVKAASKPVGRAAATKKKTYAIDSEDEDDINDIVKNASESEVEAPKPKPKATAKAATTKPIAVPVKKPAIADDSDSGSDGDSFLTGLGTLLGKNKKEDGFTDPKTAATTNGISVDKTSKVATKSKPSVNGNTKKRQEDAAVKATNVVKAQSRPAPPVHDLSILDSDTDMLDTDAAPKPTKTKAKILDAESGIDHSDAPIDNDEDESIVKPKAKAGAAKNASAKQKTEPSAKVKPVKSAPVKKPAAAAKKTSSSVAPAPAKSAPAVQSPAAKAYAKKLEKSKNKKLDVDDSDEDMMDADGTADVVDDLLDSDEDIQPKPAATRPSRRAAAAPSKAKKYDFGDDGDEDGGDGFGVQSEESEAFSMDDD
ncbi:DNA topoisomerase 2 [Lithohypha guttulata]|uniref:DNA topoisomerase 2 n=1 Tax=Lithohypha guttulata TaxID=1690604 RepID=UPI002DE0DFED|nr:DNA topoisomerase 2 [Lithohypha guttulata]